LPLYPLPPHEGGYGLWAVPAGSHSAF